MTQENTAMGTRCISPKTFDSFVVNDNNRLALSVAQTIAKAPGKIYNPVYIYGDTGTGKTHLLRAICPQNAQRVQATGRKEGPVPAPVFGAGARLATRN